MKTAKFSAEELRNTARAILEELDRPVQKTHGSDERMLEEVGGFYEVVADGWDKGNGILDERDTLEKISRQKRYRTMFSAGGATVSGTVLDEDAPRMERRQFLSQRLERRAERTKHDAADSGDEAAEEEFAVTDVRRNELTDTGLPARLSEVYRRDARRYDGAFERY